MHLDHICKSKSIKDTIIVPVSRLESHPMSVSNVLLVTRGLLSSILRC